MTAERNEIDSEVLGGNVLDISAFDPDADFSAFEGDYCERHRPLYVSCKVRSEDTGHIHLLEDYGFRFVEYQVRVSCALNRTWDVSGFGYTCQTAEGGDDLEAVLAIASSVFGHGRFFRDPFFRKWEGRNISGERFRRYVRKSFEVSDEAVYKLVNQATGEIAGFSTHRITGPESALLLLAGIKQEYDGAGLGAINDYFHWNELKKNGIRRLIGHASADNYPILNLNVHGMGFRLVQSFVILRKIYPHHLYLPISS